MHTILGANGIIGEELAKELHSNYQINPRLVGRNPKRVNDTDELFKADLLNKESTIQALKNTSIAYLTVGLPYNSDIWLRDWPIVLENVIAGCIANECKLAYFDNTYAYPQGSKIQQEGSPLQSSGKKGQAKKIAVEKLLSAIDKNEIKAVICRAPEFYGPKNTKGITNTLVFESLRNGKKPKVLVNDQVLRTLIYTPDASKAMALLANTEDCYQQTWHLPCDDNRLTYQQIISEISDQLGRKVTYTVLKRWVLNLLTPFINNLKETEELFPRYAIDNIFESSKFKKRFPAFQVTSYQEGIKEILKDFQIT